MATENCWGARKIRAELSKLGIRLSLASIARYLPKTGPDADPLQRWSTFLRNHRDLIAGMDFFVVPTLRFRLLYVWFAIDHGRRRILHCKVTESPSALWVIRQLREAFPNEPIHRFLMFDNDANRRRLLREYVAYYNAERVHTSIGDSPAGRADEAKPSRRARVIGLPCVGGLHHRYVWREAA